MTATEAEQVRLLQRALASRRENNATPEGHDRNGPYSFPFKNCSNWVKTMLGGEGLRPDSSLAYWAMNGGVGMERGLDLTGLPQTSYGLGRLGVETYDTGIGIVGGLGSFIGDVAQGIELMQSTETGNTGLGIRF